MKINFCKRALISVVVLMMLCCFCSCGDNSEEIEKQDVKFKGVSLVIPAQWKYCKDESNDNCKVYKDKKNDISFHITSLGSAVPITHQYSIDDVCKSTVDTYKSMEGISNVSEATAGTFGQDYYSCALTYDIEKDGKIYHAKSYTAYFDYDAVTFLIINTDGDFSVFDQIIAGGSYNSSGQ